MNQGGRTCWAYLKWLHGTTKRTDNIGAHKSRRLWVAWWLVNEPLSIVGVCVEKSIQKVGKLYRLLMSWPRSLGTWLNATVPIGVEVTVTQRKRQRGMERLRKGDWTRPRFGARLKTVEEFREAKQQWRAALMVHLSTHTSLPLVARNRATKKCKKY